VRVKQVSIFVENQVGRLSAVLEVLEKEQISIQAMSVSDAAEIGIIRMILTKPEEGLNELRQAGFTTRMDWVLTIEIPDVPGGLFQTVAKPIAQSGINLLYFYAYTEPNTRKTMLVLKTDDLEKTDRILQ
jgi:hypothetical protein